MEKHFYEQLERMSADELRAALRAAIERDNEIQALFPAARGLVDEIGVYRAELRRRGLPSTPAELGY
jgi:hypothetical protein